MDALVVALSLVLPLSLGSSLFLSLTRCDCLCLLLVLVQFSLTLLLLPSLSLAVSFSHSLALKIALSSHLLAEVRLLRFSQWCSYGLSIVLHLPSRRVQLKLLVVCDQMMEEQGAAA